MPRHLRELRDAGQKWLEEQLCVLEQKTYAELAALPPRSLLPTPPHLAGLKFCITRTQGDAGGVEISAREYRRFLIFESSMGPWFEMLPDGSVIHHDDDEHDPDD